MLAVVAVAALCLVCVHCPVEAQFAQPGPVCDEALTLAWGTLQQTERQQTVLLDTCTAVCTAWPRGC
jgi:hypothetical protein